MSGISWKANYICKEFEVAHEIEIPFLFNEFEETLKLY